MSPHAATDDWPQWRGNQRDGHWKESAIPDSLPAELQVSWRAAVGRGWSSPVVAGSRIVVTDVEFANGAATERVLCFDENGGQLVWSHEYAVAYPEWALDPTGGGPRATPIIHEGHVFTLGAIGHLFCLNLQTGDVRWAKNLAEEYGVKEFTGITASPLIENHLLILQLSAKPDAGVVAFEVATGREVWKALDDSFTYSSPMVITAGGERQLIVWMQEAVTSLNPLTGSIWWREVSRVPGDMAVSTPVFADGRLLVGGLMFTLDRERPGASVLWPEAEAPSKRVLSNTSSPHLQDGFVYSARTNGAFVCLDANTGKPLWETTDVTTPGNGSSIHITRCENNAFLFTDQGDLIRARLQPDAYHEIARAHLIAPTYPFGSKKRAWSPPAYANGHVIVRNDTELIRVSLASP